MKISYLSPELMIHVIHLEGGIANNSTTLNPGNQNGDVLVDDFEDEPGGDQGGTIDLPF